jgi:hypothetical protein
MQSMMPEQCSKQYLHSRIIVQRYRTLSHVSNIQERGCIAILLTLNLNRQHSVNGA